MRNGLCGSLCLPSSLRLSAHMKPSRSVWATTQLAVSRSDTLIKHNIKCARRYSCQVWQFFRQTHWSPKEKLERYDPPQISSAVWEYYAFPVSFKTICQSCYGSDWSRLTLTFLTLCLWKQQNHSFVTVSPMWVCYSVTMWGVTCSTHTVQMA